MSDHADPPLRHRTRRLKPIPTSSPAQQKGPRLTDLQSTRIISISRTGALKAAFEETPLRLRELEQGWRARRRIVLGDIEQDGDPVRRDSDETKLVRGQWTDAALKPGRDVYSGSSRGGEVRRPGGTRPSLRPAVQVISPPTPPPTPPIPNTHLPRTLDQYPNDYLPRGNQILHTPHSPLPIRSHPLPPATYPMPLTTSSKSTIQILPIPALHPSHDRTSTTGRIEIRIKLPTRTIETTNNGTTLSITPPSNSSRHIRTRTLDLAGWKEWGKGDLKDWLMVYDVIEGFKRKTPRVKMYLPLGQLVITCSTPPDIVLSYTTTERGMGEKKDARGTKVRITYSRAISQLRVDVSYNSARTLCLKEQDTAGESFKSKRVIPLRLPTEHVAKDVTVGLGLRVKGDGMGEWSQVERDGLARFWDARDEWRRWDAG